MTVIVVVPAPMAVTVLEVPEPLKVTIPLGEALKETVSVIGWGIVLSVKLSPKYKVLDVG